MHPWDQRTNETQAAFTAFIAYLHQPEQPEKKRSMRILCARLYPRNTDAPTKVRIKGMPKGTPGEFVTVPRSVRINRHIQKWAKQHEWQDRIRAFDKHQNDRLHDAMVRQNIRANVRMCDEARELQVKALKLLLDADELPPAVALAAYRDSVKLERLSRGLVGSIDQHNVAGHKGGSIGDDLPTPPERTPEEEAGRFARLLNVLHSVGLAPPGRASGEPDAED